MGFYPVVVAAFGVDRGPMLVDGGQEGLFGRCDEIVDLIAGGGRTGIVVESPCHAHGTAQTARKVDHIIIFECAGLGIV